MHLHGADTYSKASWLDPELVAVADRAGPERAGRDRADAAQGEHAIDEQAGGEGAAASFVRVGGRGQGCAQLVEAGARLGAHGDDVGAGHELAGLVDSKLERVGSDRVSLRDGDDAALDAQHAKDGEVLVRLRACALAGVDDEEEEVDPGRAGDHVADEPLVTRDVDEGDPPAVGQVERRISEVDRDPALLLLGQAVRVLPGQGPDEPGLAVVDVAGRPEAQTRHDLGTHVRDFPR